MPKIDMEAYNAASIGGFKQLMPGRYVVAIQAVRKEFEEMDWDIGARVTKTIDDKCVMFVFDIAEGEFCGEFSREFYMGADGKLDPSKDWMHEFKYRWDNIDDFKKFNYILEESNPGFDVMAAFSADRWDMYIGKKFGIVLNGTVSTNDKGYDRWTLRPGKGIYTVDDVRDGKTPAPRITDKRTPVPEDGGAEPDTDDLPF